MGASIKLNISEKCALGDVDTYILTLKVSEVAEIDPNIFIVEYTKSNPYLNKFDTEFHHVAFLPEMSSIGTTLTNDTHQYIRQSQITRSYPTLERMNESKKVMLDDIHNLIKAYNQVVSGSRESEVLINEDGYTWTTIADETYTFNGEEIQI